MLTATAYDIHVEQLFDRIRQLHQLLTAAGIPYRIVGGMAVFIHVFERDPLRARLTSDIDAALDRRHLHAVIEAAGRVGWAYRHSAGLDMLIDPAQPRARSAVRLVFLNEKVKPEYSEPVPASPPAQTSEGILLAPIAEHCDNDRTSVCHSERKWPGSSGERRARRHGGEVGRGLRRLASW